MVNLQHTSRIQKYTQKRHSNQLGQKPPIPPFPIWDVDTIEYTNPSTDATYRPKQYPDPISRFATVQPLDRQTDRPTDGLGDRPVRIPAYAPLYWL